MFAAEWRWQSVWHSFPFLAWDLSMQPRTHILIFNQFKCIRACACSSHLNYAHECIETQLMYKNVQANPQKSQKLTQHPCCSMLTLGKKLKLRRGNAYRFVQKGETFPTETIGLAVRSFGLWEAYPQTCPKWDKNFTTTCLHCSTTACQVSWILYELLIY